MNNVQKVIKNFRGLPRWKQAAIILMLPITIPFGLVIGVIVLAGDAFFNTVHLLEDSL